METDSADDTYTLWPASSAKTGSTKGGGRMNITLTAAASSSCGHMSPSSAANAKRSSIMIPKRSATTLTVDAHGMSLSTRS